MEIIITGSAFGTGVSIKNHIKDKILTVSRKFKQGQVHKIHAVLNKDGNNFLCKIDVIEEIGGKTIFHASHEATDPYPCVDFAIKKIEEQLIKYKDKMISGRNHEGATLKDKSHGLEESEIVDEVYQVLGVTEADDDAILLK